MASKGATLTLDLEPLALEAQCLFDLDLYLDLEPLPGLHWLLIWGPSLFQGHHDPWSPQRSRFFFLYLGVPLALEAPKPLDLERLLAPCSIGPWSEAPGSFKGLIVSKGASLTLGEVRTRGGSVAGRFERAGPQ